MAIPFYPPYFQSRCDECGWAGPRRYTRQWADVDAEIHEFSHKQPDVMPSALYPEWFLRDAKSLLDDVSPQELFDIHRLFVADWHARIDNPATQPKRRPTRQRGANVGSVEA